MIDVAVIAPVPALRAGLSAMLREAGADVTDAVATVEELRLPAMQRNRVVVVCAGAPLASLRALVEQRLALVWLSNDSQDAPQLAAMGWVGWAQLRTGASAAELHAAVQAVAHGLVVMDAALAQAVLPSAPPPTQADVTLTVREQEVLELISRGLPNKAIAAQLKISDSTVKFHLQGAFAKLGAASRAEAVSSAARLGLITL